MILGASIVRHTTKKSQTPESLRLVLTKVALSLFSSAQQRKENIVKALWKKEKEKENTHLFLSKVKDKVIGEAWGKLFIAKSE